jgi:hypothetical protein
MMKNDRDSSEEEKTEEGGKGADLNDSFTRFVYKRFKEDEPVPDDGRSLQ